MADAVIVLGRCDGDNLIVWSRMMTQGTNGLPWLPGTASPVVGALFAARNMAARALIAVDIANVGTVRRSACKMAARVFETLTALRGQW